jgi:hypothetical protein
MTSNKLGAALALALSMSLLACGGGSGGSKAPASSSVATLSSAPAANSSSISSVELSSSSSNSSEIESTSSSSSVEQSSSSSSVEQSSSSSSVEQSSASSSSAPAALTYNVKVDLTSFYVSKISFSLFAKAYAVPHFSKDRITLVRVDADGIVVEVLPLTANDITEVSYNRFEITSRITPSLNHILLVGDESGSALEVGDSIFGAGFLTAPLTASEFTVDVAVTAAYQAFLENLPNSFDDIEDGSESLLSAFNDVTDVIRDRVQNIPGSGIDARVAAIVAEQGSVAAALAISVSTPSNHTLKSLMSTDGFHWFMGEDGDELIHRAYSAEGEMLVYRGASTEKVSETEWEDFMSDKIYSLTDAGWELVPDLMGVSGFSENGKSMWLNFAGTSSVRIEQSFVYNLEGQSLRQTLEQVPVFNDVLQYVRGSASSVGMEEDDIIIVADAYAAADAYDMWFSDEVSGAGNCKYNPSVTLEDLNGNCEVVGGLVAVDGFPDYLTYVSKLTSLDQTINPVASEFADQLLVAAGWAENDHILLLSLKDNGTVEYYDYDQNQVENNTSLDRLEHIASGAWVKNIHASGVELIEFTLPQVAIDRGFEDERHIFLTFHDGFVRSGSKTVQGDVLARNMVFTSTTFADNFLTRMRVARD